LIEDVRTIRPFPRAFISGKAGLHGQEGASQAGAHFAALFSV
jgi:hypothetical protein